MEFEDDGATNKRTISTVDGSGIGDEGLVQTSKPGFDCYKFAEWTASIINPLIAISLQYHPGSRDFALEQDQIWGGSVRRRDTLPPQIWVSITEIPRGPLFIRVI
jgi:hypothetical protein